MTTATSTLGLMLDIETLALTPDAVLTQVALVPWYVDDPESECAMLPVHSFMPIQPQLNLIPSRVISASTLGWWFKQSDAARARFDEHLSIDHDEMMALARHFITRFNSMTDHGKVDYQLWAARPQFDIVVVESFLRQCGLQAPWAYDKVYDLRTAMGLAGLGKGDVEKPHGFVAHDAMWDAKFQIHCHTAATLALRHPPRVANPANLGGGLS